MDREVFLNLISRQVQIITDEHFILKGEIKEVYESSFSFLTHGKIRYIDFNRVYEVRPYE